MQSAWERIFFRSNLRRCRGVFLRCSTCFCWECVSHKSLYNVLSCVFVFISFPKVNVFPAPVFVVELNQSCENNERGQILNIVHSFCFSTIKFNFPFQRRPNLKLKLLSCGYMYVVLEQSSTHIKEVGATCVIMSNSFVAKHIESKIRNSVARYIFDCPGARVRTVA